MTSTDGPQRRTVLAAALAGTAVFAVPVLQPARAAAATPSGPGLTALEGQRATRLVHAPDGSCSQVPAQLGALVTVGPAGAPAGTAVTFTYDERLYSAAPRAFLTGGGRLIPVESRPAATTAAHGRQLDLLLPELGPGSYGVHAGGLVPARFPADLVADPLPTVVRVSEPGRAAVVRTLSAPAAKAELPWGAQLGAGWQQTRWSDRYHAWHPAIITVHSVGPGAIPAGAGIRVTLDRRVFGSVAITAASDPAGRKVDGADRRTTAAGRPVATWTAHAPVAAGARITLTCGAGVRSLTGPLDDVEAPLIEFLPGGSGGPQRSTGQESITRVDDVYSAATRARYGPG
ncbi:hypothetical protein [Saccharothrix xinjiangensis]|uniref:Uncharacterized protein n=1 Tax=Saccharothrix xinjiangensis TaxID=204798 RepID=A0ABV9Y4C1_9PSEU